ncbi:MAG TPA: hypothetical protein VGK25_11070 [Ignavibacteria bacterium]|jgi:hypothetical protein
MSKKIYLSICFLLFLFAGFTKAQDPTIEVKVPEIKILEGDPFGIVIGGQYDREGYDKYGYDRYGYDRYGYDRNGYDRNGHDKYGNYNYNTHQYNPDYNTYRHDNGKHLGWYKQKHKNKKHDYENERENDREKYNYDNDR